MTRLVAVMMHSEISITHKLMLFSTVGDFELLSFPCAWLEEAARAVHRFERSWHNLLSLNESNNNCWSGKDS